MTALKIMDACLAFNGALIEFRFNVDPAALEMSGWGSTKEALADLCLRDGHALLCRPSGVVAGGLGSYQYRANKPSKQVGAGFAWRRPSVKKVVPDWHEVTLELKVAEVENQSVPALRGAFNLQHRIGKGKVTLSHQVAVEQSLEYRELSLVSWTLDDNQYALVLDLAREAGI